MPVVWPWQRHRDRRRLRAGSPTVGSSVPLKGAALETPPPSPLEDDGFVSGLRPVPTADSPVRRPLPIVELSGATPLGTTLRINLVSQPWTLLCFLATRCEGCEEFWRQTCGAALPQVLGGVSHVVITKSDESVDPDEVRALAGDRADRVLMSDGAWKTFEVLGYPTFVLIDGSSASVVGETVAFTWTDVEGMIAASAPGILSP